MAFISVLSVATCLGLLTILHPSQASEVLRSRRAPSAVAREFGQKESDYKRTYLVPRDITTEPGFCRSFDHVPGSFSLGGDVLRKVAEDISAAECRQACLDVTDFICSAAEIQLPGTCFLLGYRLYSVNAASHYTRTCNHGPSCFKKIEGFSSTTSDEPLATNVPIPRQYQQSADIHALYCMVHCELMDSHCVGFDLRQVAGTPICHFETLKVIQGPSFDLYIRRC